LATGTITYSTGTGTGLIFNFLKEILHLVLTPLPSGGLSFGRFNPSLGHEIFSKLCFCSKKSIQKHAGPTNNHATNLFC
jgi:hypothetical protein